MEDLRKKMREIKQGYRREFLKMRGIDVDAFDKLNRRYDKLLSEAFSGADKQMAKRAEEIKARHMAIVVGIQKSGRVDPAQLSPSEIRCMRIGPISFWRCEPPTILAQAEDSGEEIRLSTNIILDGNKAEANPSPSTNKCHPYIEHHDDGDIDVHAWLSYSYRPATAGYCRISPLVLLNGYYLFQMFGGGCSGGVGSSGTMKVSTTLKVEQLGETREESEIPMFEHASSDGYFEPLDRVVQHDRYVYLEHADRDATIKVGIRVKTSVSGAGNIFVDVKRNSNFYFWVQKINVSHCHFVRPLYPTIEPQSLQP